MTHRPGPGGQRHWRDTWPGVIVQLVIAGALVALVIFVAQTWAAR